MSLLFLKAMSLLLKMIMNAFYFMTIVSSGSFLVFFATELMHLSDWNQRISRQKWFLKLFAFGLCASLFALLIVYHLTIIRAMDEFRLLP